LCSSARAFPQAGDGQALRGRALDDRDELHEAGAQLVAEEAVHLDRVVAVRGVDGAQDIDIHPVRPQELPPAPHLVERARAALVDPIGVVHRLRAIHAEAHKKAVFLEEGAPRVIEPSPVGLDRVGDLLVRLPVLLHAGDRPLEELETHQRRLAALPRDHHLRPLLRLQQLPDVGVQHLVTHPESAAGVQLLLRQEEAVLAVQVADGACWLRQQVKRVGQTRGAWHRLQPSAHQESARS